MKTYQIRSGHSFRIDAVTVLESGASIDLPDDVAAIHADKIERVSDDSVPDPVPKAIKNDRKP